MSYRQHKEALVDRDGATCFYCDALLAVADRDFVVVPDYVWGVVEIEGHCGCGKHRMGELCVSPGGLTPAPGLSEVSIDHVRARHHGGSDAIENLVLTCASCNSQKHTFPAWLFMLRRTAVVA